MFNKNCKKTLKPLNFSNVQKCVIALVNFVCWRNVNTSKYSMNMLVASDFIFITVRKRKCRQRTGEGQNHHFIIHITELLLHGGFLFTQIPSTVYTIGKASKCFNTQIKCVLQQNKAEKDWLFYQFFFVLKTFMMFNEFWFAIF